MGRERNPDRRRRHRRRRAAPAPRRRAGRRRASGPRSRPYVQGDCLVAFDAPLVVNNPTGPTAQRGGAQPRLREVRGGRPPRLHRQARVREHAARSPAGRTPSTSTSIRPRARGRRAIEVYPHPATIALFRLEPHAEVQEGRVRAPPARAAEADDAHRGARPGDAAVARQPHVGWVDLRRRVEAATQTERTRRAEDPVDAVSAPTSRCTGTPTGRRDGLRRRRVRLHRHADIAHRSGPGARNSRSASRHEDVLGRLGQVAALLQEAQAELSAIREEFRG